VKESGNRLADIDGDGECLGRKENLKEHHLTNITMGRIFTTPVQCRFLDTMHYKVYDALMGLGYEARAISPPGRGATTWYTNWQLTYNRATNSPGLINPAERFVVPDGNYEFFMAVAAMSEGPRFWPREYVSSKDGLLGPFVDYFTDFDALVFNGKENVSIPLKDIRRSTLDEIGELFEFPIEVRPAVNVESRDNHLPEFGEMIQVWNNAHPRRFNRFYVGTNRSGKIVTVGDNPNEFSEARNAELNFFDNWAKFGTEIVVSDAEAREYLASLVFGTGTFPEQVKIVK
jgi:hypothetical protein